MNENDLLLDDRSSASGGFVFKRPVGNAARKLSTSEFLDRVQQGSLGALAIDSEAPKRRVTAVLENGPPPRWAGKDRSALVSNADCIDAISKRRGGSAKAVSCAASPGAVPQEDGLTGVDRMDPDVRVSYAAVSWAPGACGLLAGSLALCFRRRAGKIMQLD